MSPQRPPTTAREAAHLFLGEDHANCCVVEAIRFSDGFHLTCSCGEQRFISMGKVHEESCTMREVEESVRNAKLIDARVK